MKFCFGEILIRTFLPYLAPFLLQMEGECDRARWQWIRLRVVVYGLHQQWSSTIGRAGTSIRGATEQGLYLGARGK